MSDQDDAPEKEEGDAGAPAWVMTFADLMSLLMCFFVLLLSFSEMDVQKFKQIAGSMEVAFGVQRDITAHDIPKGTSIVAREFSPGKTEQPADHEIRQSTADPNQKKLEEKQQADQKAARIASNLKEEIEQGVVEVEVVDNKVVLRVLEKGSFSSGGADLNETFLPVMVKMRDVISEVKGDIKVAGHTDNVPIRTSRYRSNWELSAARAVSVVHVLADGQKIPTSRFEITGFGSSRPRVKNDSDENRAQNRRIEIIIEQE